MICILYIWTVYNHPEVDRTCSFFLKRFSHVNEVSLKVSYSI